MNRTCVSRFDRRGRERLSSPVDRVAITTVCCVCGQHLDGPWPAQRELSHGYCEFHHQLARREIERYFDTTARASRASVAVPAA